MEQLPPKSARPSMEAPGPPRLFRVYSFRPTAWEHEVLEDFPAFLINLLGVVEIRYELDVAFGSFSEINARIGEVRSAPANGHHHPSAEVRKVPVAEVSY